MSQQVLTIHGLIDIDRLEIEDVVTTGDGYRKIATEYRLNGELVRRDVVANALRGPGMEGQPGKLNG